MPRLPSSEPLINCIDDLDFLKDFENEFPAIVYNDAQMSKADLLTEPILSSQHIDEFDLKYETSLSQCDEEEQNVLNFNDLFPFNVIYPNDSKSDKDNDDDKVDFKHSLGDLSVKPLPDVINTDRPSGLLQQHEILEWKWEGIAMDFVTKIIEKVGLVAYRLRLPEELNGVHDTFHVSNLKKCLGDPTLQVPLDEIQVDAQLNFVEEPV
nr:putative reverse transcriptase domain-containing protein [Tanacetum cinerariifolium]